MKLTYLLFIAMSLAVVTAKSVKRNTPQDSGATATAQVPNKGPNNAFNYYAFYQYMYQQYMYMQYFQYLNKYYPQFIQQMYQNSQHPPKPVQQTVSHPQQSVQNSPFKHPNYPEYPLYPPYYVTSQNNAPNVQPSTS